MKLKSFALVAALATGVAPAIATQTVPVTANLAAGVPTVLDLGAITFASVSNLTGTLFAATQAVVPGFGTFNLSPVSFSVAALTGPTAVSQPTGNNFSFSSLTAGTYHLWATVTSQNGGGAFIGANYNVTPVPEPETYALLLAGLGVVGFVARRRRPQ